MNLLHEEEMFCKLDQGIDDVKLGRTLPHKEAMEKARNIRAQRREERDHGKKRYKIAVIERLKHVEEVEAVNPEDALQMVKLMYEQGGIKLDYRNYDGYEIELEEDASNYKPRGIGVNVAAIVRYARENDIPLSEVPEEIVEMYTYDC